MRENQTCASGFKTNANKGNKRDDCLSWRIAGIKPKPQKRCKSLGKRMKQMICDMTEFLANLKLERAPTLTRRYSAFSQFTLQIIPFLLLCDGNWVLSHGLAQTQGGQGYDSSWHRVLSCKRKWVMVKYVTAGESHSDWEQGFACNLLPGLCF